MRPLAAIVTLTMLLLICLLSTGCALIDQERVHDGKNDSLPWNSEAGWEGHSIGVPL